MRNRSFDLYLDKDLILLIDMHNDLNNDTSYRNDSRAVSSPVHGWNRSWDYPYSKEVTSGNDGGENSEDQSASSPKEVSRRHRLLEKLSLKSGLLGEKITEVSWIFIIFMISRCVLFSIIYLGNYHYPSEVNYIHEPLFSNVVGDTMNIMCQFDCAWFETVARDGYAPVPQNLTTGHAANWAFLPGYPMLARAVSFVLGGNYLLGLMAVSNLSFLLALFLWNNYLKLHNLSRSVREASTVILCFLPYSIYFMAPYSESLFLVFSILAFTFIAKKNFLMAGLVAMGMSATRNVGVMFVFPLLLAGIMEYGFRNLFTFNRNNLKLILGIMLVPLPMFIYQNYLFNLTGDSFAFMHIQWAWGRSMGNPVKYVIQGLMTGGYKEYFSIMIIMSLPLVWYLFRQKYYAESLYFIICILIPVMTGVNAFPRYLFCMLPCLLTFTLIVKNNMAARSLLPVVFALFSVFFALAWGHSKFFVI